MIDKAFPIDGEDDADPAAVAADSDEEGEGANDEQEDADPAAVAAGTDSKALAVIEPLKDPKVAEQALQSATLLKTYTQAIASLKEVGAASAAVHLESELRKETRRQRAQQRENSAVAEAFQRLREQEALEEMRERQRVYDALAAKKTLQDQRRALKDAEEKLRKRKLEILDAERLVEAQHSIKNFALDSLGQGKARSGGVIARKARAAVLDRLARLGTGLSGAQRNDWDWFKTAWDEKMREEHDEEWGGVFARWMQQWEL